MDAFFIRAIIGITVGAALGTAITGRNAVCAA